MAKPIIIANWKMNPSSDKDAAVLFSRVRKGIAGIKKADVVICPPFVYFAALFNIVRGRSTALGKLGAQDIFWEESGAFTGEISAGMVKKAGATYAIIGHSERRRNLGETDEMVNKKIKAALRSGIVPIVCVGEWMREVPGVIPEIVETQVRAALAGLTAGEFKNGVIAYEPVWAIGTGTPETPEGATKAAMIIRKIVREMLGPDSEKKVRVIYGGSVNAENAASFIARNMRGMEGLLVGGASLKADEFVKIVKSM